MLVIKLEDSIILDNQTVMARKFDNKKEDGEITSSIGIFVKDKEKEEPFYIIIPFKTTEERDELFNKIA